jgi:hypothetical protein
MSPIRRQRATLTGFAQMFLQEIDRANLSFSARRIELVRALANPAERALIIGSLGGAGNESEMLASALASQAAEAARLAIEEVTVTFWVEPARPGFWECIGLFLRALFCCRSGNTLAGLYCLAPAERRDHAAKYELRIAPACDMELTVSQPRPVPALASMGA